MVSLLIPDSLNTMVLNFIKPVVIFVMARKWQFFFAELSLNLANFMPGHAIEPVAQAALVSEKSDVMLRQSTGS